MANNVTANPGTGGATFATDDVGGVHYPITKIAYGAEDSADMLDEMPAVKSAQDLILAAINALIALHKAEDAAHVNGDLGIPALGIRQAADTTSTDADGDYTLLKIDEEGRLKVSSKPASYADITGDITAVQATIGTPVAGGTVTGDVSRASNIMAFCLGTFSGVNCTFEGSLELTGDNNWFGIQAVRSNANTIETATGALSAAPAYAWEMSVNALKRVRVRCTARTSGTQSWRFVQGTYATEPIPAAQISGTQPVSFTQPALVAGTAAIGDVGIQARANATGAASISKLQSAASTNATSVKATAGRVFGWTLTNTTASAKVVRLYNLAAAPTVGTSVPVYNIVIPPNATVSQSIPVGLSHATGIAYSITGGLADLDATAVAANDVIGSIYWA